MQSFDYTVIAITVLAVSVVAFLLFDYLTLKSIFVLMLRYFREIRYGKMYVEIEDKIKDTLQGRNAVHHLDLHVSDDMFIYNASIFRKVLADLIKTGVVAEIHYNDNASIPYYRMNTL